MDLLATLGQTLYPGQRIPRVKGWNGAVNYHIPRDCEATLLDYDNPDIVYFKKNDANGNEQTAWYDIHERAVPEFDPDKYVSTEKFNERMEKIEHGIDILTKSFASKFGTITEDAD